MDKQRSPIRASPDHHQYHRLKYYSAIRTGMKHYGRSATHLSTPAHIIDPSLFLFSASKSTQKQSSISTILSVCNSMIGSSLVSLPWAFSDSGLVLGILITFGIFLISFYTWYLIIITSENVDDYADTVYKYFGKNGWRFSIGGSVVIIMSVWVIYYEIMSQSLYPCINALLKWTFGVESKFTLEPAFNRFSLQYSWLILTAILFPVISMKEISIFIRLNVFGSVFVMMVLLFIVSYGFYGLFSTKYTFVQTEAIDESDMRYVPLFSKNFASLAGMLWLGYYLHNVSIPIIKNNSNPKNNIRDVFLGYFLAFFLYFCVGVFGLFGFKGILFGKNALSSTQNALNLFSESNMIAFIARWALFFQMFWVYPLLFYIMRIQFSALVFETHEMTPFSVIMFNVWVLGLSSIVGASYPQIGSLLGIVGSVLGLFLMYLLPIAVYLRMYYLSITDSHFFDDPLNKLRNSLNSNAEYDISIKESSPNNSKLIPKQSNPSPSQALQNSESALLHQAENEDDLTTGLISGRQKQESHSLFGKVQKQLKKRWPLWGFYISWIFHWVLIWVGLWIFLLQFISF